MNQALQVAGDSRIPARDRCVLRDVLERWCREKPEAPFIKEYGGATLSYATFRDEVVATAAGFARLGVRQGETVAVWMPNGLDILRLWFAINWLGAVYVPINIGYRGNLLGHALAVSKARRLVAHHELAPRLRDVDTGVLDTLVAIGGSPGEVGSLNVLPGDALIGDACDVPPLQRPIEPWDPQSIIFTSGTTGPSKGVLSSYAHMHAMSGEHAFPMLTAAVRCSMSAARSRSSPCSTGADRSRSWRSFRRPISGRRSVRRRRVSCSCSAPWRASSMLSPSRPATATIR